MIGENRSTRTKHVPVLICPPQIPRGLAWDRIWAPAARGRRLNAGAMKPDENVVVSEERDGGMSVRTTELRGFKSQKTQSS